MDLKITPSGQTIVKPTALGPGANTDTKLLIYGLFQKGRVLAQDAVPRRCIPWKSIDHLLCRPLGGRMFGDIEMNDTATVVAKDDEDEQNSEGCSR